MKNLYLLILFIGLSLFSVAQTGKTDASSSVEVKVLKFYPNPATSFINFEIQRPADKTYTLQIFNFIGKKVFEITNVSEKNTVPLNDFYRGVYIFQLRDNSGRILESGKFQIK